MKSERQNNTISLTTAESSLANASVRLLQNQSGTLFSVNQYINAGFVQTKFASKGSDFVLFETWNYQFVPKISRCINILSPHSIRKHILLSITKYGFNDNMSDFSENSPGHRTLQQLYPDACSFVYMYLLL